MLIRIGAYLASALALSCQTANPPEVTLAGCWSEVAKPPTGHLNDVFFLDEATGWVAGDRGLAASTDGGRTWIDVDAGLPKEFWRGVLFLDRKRGFLVGGLASPHEDGIPARIAATQDGGRTWKDLTPAWANLNAAFDRVQFVSDQEGFVFGSRLLASSDRGGTWTQVGKGEAVFGLRSVFTSPKVGWRVDGTDLLRTKDGGHTWEATSFSRALPEDERKHNGPEALHFRDDRLGWVVTGWANVYQTEDGGQTWQRMGHVGRGFVRQIIFTSPTEGWVLMEQTDGSLSRIMKTTDGGRTWLESHRSARLLNRMSFCREGIGWAVGDGVVLRYEKFR